MKIRLNQNQMDYLYSNFLKDRTDLELKSKSDKRDNIYLIEVDDIMADEIRDWANLQLQIKGFDECYNLTEEGKLLDALNDSFYL